MDGLDEYVQEMHSLKYFIGSFVTKGHFSHFSSWENHFPVAKIIDVILAVEYANLKLEDVVAFVDGNIEKSVGDRLVTADSLTTTSQVRLDNIRSSFKTEQQFAICFAKTLWLAWCAVCFLKKFLWLEHSTLRSVVPVAVFFHLSLLWFG